jgi:hypothetical protein
VGTPPADAKLGRLREGRTAIARLRCPVDGTTLRVTLISSHEVGTNPCRRARCTEAGQLRGEVSVPVKQIKLPSDSVRADLCLGVPIVNQIRTYWWCSPPRIGRQRMRPASSTARQTGASFSKDKCVRTSL